MITLKYFIPYFLFSFLISITSYLTVGANYPTMYAPYSLISAVPVVMFPSYFVVLVVLPIIYLLWSFPLATGQKQIPTRTNIISITLVLLSFIYLMMGWQYGITYQGFFHVISMYVFNILFWSILLVLNLINRSSPAFLTNILYHGILFIWLSWVAFPWLGESI